MMVFKYNWSYFDDIFFSTFFKILIDALDTVLYAYTVIFTL